MDEKLHKYAEVLLKSCLKVENQPLFISVNMERVDFLKIVLEEAYKIGVKDIYFDITNVFLKHDLLKYFDVDSLKKHQYWNKDIWNVYAKKNAAFLMLASENPGLMDDIDKEKIIELTNYALGTRKEFDELRDKSQLSWCIALVPTQSFAEKVLGDKPNVLDEMWNVIFEICGINKDDPNLFWEDKLQRNQKIAAKLNEFQFDKLRYTNSLGTNLEIKLPINHIWQSGEEIINGKKVLVNFPTEEIFTSPLRDGINGIVYSSKPLSYQETLIDDFCLRIKDGKVVDVKAKVGEEVLLGMISSTENMDYFGEVALVPYDSSISNSKLIFYETLYDENASCHLALGSSFPECLKDGIKMSKEELEKAGLNQSLNHVDFMIGTDDLEIVGITKDNKEIKVFENGNYSDVFR